jgi:hypothetical protein
MFRLGFQSLAKKLEGQFRPLFLHLAMDDSHFNYKQKIPQKTAEK